jgi:capsular polysaccharide biosynthesis protein
MGISNHKLPEAENEISLADLILALFKHWHVVVALPVIAVLGTWGVVSSFPNKWEARAILEIGTIGAVGGTGIAKVETPFMLIERLKLRALHERAGQALGLARDSQDIERFIGDISASRVKNSDLVELKVRALSRQDAEKRIMAIIQVVQENHLKAVEHIQQSFARKLEERKREYEALKTQIKVYRGWFKISQNVPERIFGGAELFTAAYVASVDIRLQQLVSEIADLKILVSRPLEYPTQIFGGNVYVPPKPVFPRRGLFMLLALLAGLFAALLFVFVRLSLRNTGKNAKAADKLEKIHNPK